MTAAAGVPTNRPKIAVIDDHQMIREGFRHLAGYGFRIGALADTVDDLFGKESDPTRRSSIVVLDVSLADRSWVVDNVKRLRQAGYRVVVMTSTSIPDPLREALAAGASALVGKNDQIGPLVEAIRAVHNGERLYVSSQMAQAIYTSSVALTPAEREVLRHAAGGLTKEEIAMILHTTDEAVESCFRGIASAYREAYPEVPGPPGAGGLPGPRNAGAEG
jgi:DNA-binding NarL/FixJ family response regulator